MHEVACSTLCVMARYGYRTGKKSGRICGMPSQSEITPPPHKAAPLGVDRKAMVMAACRFAAPFLGRVFLLLVNTYTK